MLWKNPWLWSKTGSSEGNTNIYLVERTTFRVHCVLTSKCNHPVCQRSTKSMWECTCFFGTQAKTRSPNTSCAKLFLFLTSTGTNRVLPSPLCLSFMFVKYKQAVSGWTTAASTEGPASLPLLPWSPWQKYEQKHLLCPLPLPGSPFILDNAAASDEGKRDCQNVHSAYVSINTRFAD